MCKTIAIDSKGFLQSPNEIARPKMSFPSLYMLFFAYLKSETYSHLEGPVWFEKHTTILDKFISSANRKSMVKDPSHYTSGILGTRDPKCEPNHDVVLVA